MATSATATTEEASVPPEEPAGQVYLDHCLICNHVCYLPEKVPPASTPRITEVRTLFYTLYQIPVSKKVVASIKADLPLCSGCLYRLGRLKSLKDQLALLQREFTRLRESIAFDIVDVVARSEKGSSTSNKELGYSWRNVPEEAMVKCLRDAEVDTLQQVVFDDWFERHATDYENDFDLKEEEFARKEISNGKKPNEPPTFKTPPPPPPQKRKNKNAPPPPILKKGSHQKMSNSPNNLNRKMMPPPPPTIPKKPKLSESMKRGPSSILSPLPSFYKIGLEKFSKNSHHQNKPPPPPFKTSPQKFSLPYSLPKTTVISITTANEKSPESTDAGTKRKLSPEKELDIFRADELLSNKRVKSEETSDVVTPQNNAEESPSVSVIKVPAPAEQQDPNLQIGEFFGDFLEGGCGQLVEDGVEVENGLSPSDDDGSRYFDDFHSSNGSSDNMEMLQNEEGLYVCMYCAKTFIHKYPYRDHLKTHTGEGPRCPICSKIFPKNHNLMLHLRTHTGEKPFTCDICQKGFADKSNLKVHYRTHTGERPYRCTDCGQAFVNSSRLVVHRRVHLNNSSSHQQVS